MKLTVLEIYGQFVAIRALALPNVQIEANEAGD